MDTNIEKRKRKNVKAEDYTRFYRDGYLIVKGLLSQADTAYLQQWADDIYEGKVNLDHLTHSINFGNEAEKRERIASARIHMAHRAHETAEWGMLHFGIVDVLEALIGPDVLALQSMLFFNPPGKGGQGWHQDSMYIQTAPDTLIGAWVALDDVDQENGCLWVAPGSHHEPIYPPLSKIGYVHANDEQIDGLFKAKHASHLDDEVNQLSEVVKKYGDIVPVELEPGDVLFFHSHLLHRSYQNQTKDRMRRSYVCHYCNARSWVPWNHGEPYEGPSANREHILARGKTHLPFATPKFGTTVELSSEDQGEMNVAMPGGDMGKMEM
ncbi:phytanoyl-CoA dioxygenase family protein [Litoribacterium kuwaitense]|uniref:phytanoyl-CoA dioxygenase family protein n=1 Tax=Litoribacterium kuwaitense TaxID=1398745 RepID=UPI0028ACC76D|nr:phytanoyl-CoA dioxygenase family protein [Litoribacterium kuwaitense]